MKKIFALLLAVTTCLLSVGLTACAPTNPTLYVYTHLGFAPYEYVDKNGDMAGVDIDIMRYVGKQLGYDVIISDIKFNQILYEVTQNEYVVGAAGMSEKPARNEIAIPSIPYAESIQYIIVEKGALGDISTDTKVPFSDLQQIKKPNKKLVIGYQMGTTGETMLENSISAGELGNSADGMGYSNGVLACNDVGSTIDAVILDKLPAEDIVKGNSKLQCFELQAEHEQYVFYFNKKATALRDKVNVVLQQMKSTGLIDEYTIKHSNNA